MVSPELVVSPEFELRLSSASTGSWESFGGNIGRYAAEVNFHYFNNPDDLRHGLIAYRREAPATAAQAAESIIILLNFSDLETEVWIPFPTAGTWIEQTDLDNDPKPPIHVADDGQWRPVRIPSNYGGVYLKLHLSGPEGYPTAARLPSPSPPISSRPG